MSLEVLQIVTIRNKFGTGTNASFLHHVVVMIFVVVVVVVVVVVHGGDGDKIENSLIPLSVPVILLNANVYFFYIVCEIPEYWRTCFNYCLVIVSILLEFN